MKEEHPIQNEKSLEQGARVAGALLEAEDVVELEANLGGQIVLEVECRVTIIKIDQVDVWFVDSG